MHKMIIESVHREGRKKAGRFWITMVIRIQTKEGGELVVLERLTGKQATNEGYVRSLLVENGYLAHSEGLPGSWLSQLSHALDRSRPAEAKEE